MTEQVQEGNTPKKKSIKEQARKKDQFGKPMRRVKFLNNEDGNVDIAFSYQPKGGEAEGYHLLHGVEYQLPDYIIAYINELAYPMYEIEQDSNTGQMQHVQVGSFNRFTLHPLE